MSFMQRQITIKQKWYRVEDKYGESSIVPFDAVTYPADVESFEDYLESGKPVSFELIEGYGARLSAPGYLDCTEWTVFDTPEKAEKYLDEMYPEDEEDSEKVEA